MTTVTVEIPKAPRAVKTEASVLKALTTLRQSVEQRKALAAALAREVALAQEKYGPTLAKLDERSAQYEAKILEWLKEHKEELDGEKRSKDLGLAVVGFRKGQRKLVAIGPAEDSGWDWVRAKALEVGSGIKGYFKKQVSYRFDQRGLVKDAEKFSEEDLANCGLKIVQEDRPYIDFKNTSPQPNKGGKS